MSMSSRYARSCESEPPKYGPLPELPAGVGDTDPVHARFTLVKDELHHWIVCDMTQWANSPDTPKAKIEKAGMWSSETGYLEIVIHMTGREYRRVYAELTGKQ
jgi:hypothetical protein